MRTALLLLLCLFACAFAQQVATAQSPAAPNSILDYLTPKEGAKLLLELDLDSLLQNRKNANYLPAVLTDGNDVSFHLEVRTRGKFRRRKCEIPPIKLKFSKEELAAHQLDTLNEIKLVLPCSNTASDNDPIIREYIAYRIYESLTPFCARARLVRLGLKHTNEKRPQRMYALLVEHEEQVVARLHGTPVMEWGIPVERLNTDQVALMILFQFMIGNTDWDISACRNILLLQPETDEKLVSIPFDFDFSGLVNASYAVPSSESNLDNVLDRFLMSGEIDSAALQRAKQFILARKGDLYAWMDDKFVTVDAATEMRNYLDVFFAAMAESETIPTTLKFSKK